MSFTGIFISFITVWNMNPKFTLFSPIFLMRSFFQTQLVKGLLSCALAQKEKSNTVKE